MSNNEAGIDWSLVRIAVFIVCANLAGCASEYVPGENVGTAPPGTTSQTSAALGSGLTEDGVLRARQTIKNGFLSDHPHWVIGTENTSDAADSPLLNYASAANVEVTRRKVSITTKAKKKIEIPLDQIRVKFQDSMGPPCFLNLGVNLDYSIVLGGSGCLERGKPFVDAFAILRNAAIAASKPPSPEEEARFAQVVSQYPETTQKPALPESVRALRVQAEGAIRDKDFDQAEEYLSQALEIAPWWPEGHFNRALILAELGAFPPAIAEMQHYLALVPHAQNARAAQDKIYDWKRRAQ